MEWGRVKISIWGEAEGRTRAGRVDRREITGSSKGRGGVGSGCYVGGAMGETDIPLRSSPA